MDQHTEHGSSPLREALIAQSGHDPILQEMLAHNMPLDRETYLAMCWPEGPPEPLGTEHEAELPVEFRRR
jgi:hypothetical protein